MGGVHKHGSGGTCESAKEKESPKLGEGKGAPLELSLVGVKW